MTRAVLAAAATAAALIVLAGCGGDDGGDAFTPQDLQAGMIAREQYTPETAACISDHLLATFPVDVLRPLADPEPHGVPPQILGRYVQYALACQYHDEVGVAADGTPTEATP